MKIPVEMYVESDMYSWDLVIKVGNSTKRKVVSYSSNADTEPPTADDVLVTLVDLSDLEDELTEFKQSIRDGDYS
jgi:hypothetical protein